MKHLKQLFDPNSPSIPRSLLFALMAANLAAIATGIAKDSHLMTVSRSLLLEPFREPIPAAILAVLLGLEAIYEFCFALSRQKSRPPASLDRFR
jgi:hypothetical protein